MEVSRSTLHAVANLPSLHHCHLRLPLFALITIRILVQTDYFSVILRHQPVHEEWKATTAVQPVQQVP